MESEGRGTKGEMKTVGSSQPRGDGDCHTPRVGVHQESGCSGHALPSWTQLILALVDGDS